TAEMRRRLEAARPDALVMFTNDHLLNWPINNIPEYAVGIGEEHVGPADWFDEWLGMEKYRVPGHPALARWIVDEGARRPLQVAACTVERLAEAGSGGTAELLSWFLALAMTRGPADVLAYMPAVAWRSGTGMVAWGELAGD